MFSHIALSLMNGVTILLRRQPPEDALPGLQLAQS
jgi:hypothetical protein